MSHRPWGLREVLFSGLLREEFKQREIIHDPDIFPSAKGRDGRLVEVSVPDAQDICAGGNGSVHDWVVFGIERTTGSPRCGSTMRATDRNNSTWLWISSPVSLYKACMRG